MPPLVPSKVHPCLTGHRRHASPVNSFRAAGSRCAAMEAVDVWGFLLPPSGRLAVWLAGGRGMAWHGRLARPFDFAKIDTSLWSPGGPVGWIFEFLLASCRNQFASELGGGPPVKNIVSIARSAPTHEAGTKRYLASTSGYVQRARCRPRPGRGYRPGTDWGGGSRHPY